MPWPSPSGGERQLATVARALSKGLDLIFRMRLSGLLDPEPAMTSRKQHVKRPCRDSNPQ